MISLGFNILASINYCVDIWPLQAAHKNYIGPYIGTLETLKGTFGPANPCTLVICYDAKILAVISSHLLSSDCTDALECPLHLLKHPFIPKGLEFTRESFWKGSVKSRTNVLSTQLY